MEPTRNIQFDAIVNKGEGPPTHISFFPDTPMVEYQSPKTQECCFLLEIEMDLKLALEAIAAAKTISSKDPNNPFDSIPIKIENQQKRASDVILTHLFNSALTFYAKCYSPGSRITLLANDIFGGDEGTKKIHTYFIEYRNRYIAHPVNRFQQAKYGIYLSSLDPNTAEHRGNGPIGVSLLKPENLKSGEDTLDALEKVCKLSLSHTQKRKEKITSEIQTNLAKIPMSVICKYPRFSITAEPHENVMKGKDRIQTPNARKNKNKRKK